MATLGVPPDDAAAEPVAAATITVTADATAATLARERTMTGTPHSQAHRGGLPATVPGHYVDVRYESASGLNLAVAQYQVRDLAGGDADHGGFTQRAGGRCRSRQRRGQRGDDWPMSVSWSPPSSALIPAGAPWRLALRRPVSGTPPMAVTLAGLARRARTG